MGKKESVFEDWSLFSTSCLPSMEGALQHFLPAFHWKGVPIAVIAWEHQFVSGVSPTYNFCRPLKPLAESARVLRSRITLGNSWVMWVSQTKDIVIWYCWASFHHSCLIYCFSSWHLVFVVSGQCWSFMAEHLQWIYVRNVLREVINSHQSNK